jgi:hypothetical protein
MVMIYLLPSVTYHPASPTLAKYCSNAMDMYRLANLHTYLNLGGIHCTDNPNSKDSISKPISIKTKNHEVVDTEQPYLLVKTRSSYDE